MKKLFVKTFLVLCALGTTTLAFAQEATESAIEGGFHHALKIKFIEGSASFMSVISILFILGLGFCLERVIYLNMSSINAKGLLKKIEDALKNNDVEGAKKLAANARGPIASIVYQGLMRIDQGIDMVEKSVVSYGGVQSGLLEKNFSWIALFIALSPSVGFMGTVVGMIIAFDDIEKAGDISPTVVAGGMKVCLITTIAGLVASLTLQTFYNYLLSRMEEILNQMEDASIDLLDILFAHSLRNNK